MINPHRVETNHLSVFNELKKTFIQSDYVAMYEFPYFDCSVNSRSLHEQSVVMGWMSHVTC